MCRNIKPLFNFDSPASEQEILDASLQFVRKISGMRTPSEKNTEAFNDSVLVIASEIQNLLQKLQPSSKPKNREVEKLKRIEKSKRRFAAS